MTDKPINWQPLSMIPVFIEMVDEMLKSAEIQLTQLKQAEHRPHVLDDETVNRVLKSYSEQNELMPIYLQQCQRWEKEELNDNQRQWVSTIKEQSTALTIVNEKIIQIARDLSSKTINKILEKSDLEVALDFLSKS
jgi:hypothetical protein